MTDKRRRWPPRFDDFKKGDQFESYRRTVTESDLITFTGLAGLKLPVFLDEDFARDESPYGRRIVPGFLTAALSAGMMESVLGPDLVAGLGMDAFQFHSPVRPGDTIRARFTVNQARPTRDRSRGVLTLHIEVLNQDTQCVLEYMATVMMLARV